ncbi:hypothetical protein G6F37_010757 [Rhizopus arrhizus]|nr:hypothetical protein G6F38_009993 [Rhizopus arrhizus]KAG1152733.1 hypothetical protein G6F37_010757 [Rhizopus arrhizus]
MSIYVITGASRGIGLEFVRQVSSKGNTVFACARNPDQSEELRQLTDNKSVYSVKLDVTCDRSLKEAVQEVSKHATEGIDVLINNAGLTLTKNNVEEAPKDELIKVFETNVTGVTETTKAFLPLLRKRGSDHTKKILNISSSVGSISNTSSTGSAAYRISKSALNMTTKLQALHLAKENFIVYASHPGWVQTDMGGKEAKISPEESVKGQLAKLESATEQDNGGYFDWQSNPLDY